MNDQIFPTETYAERDRVLSTGLQSYEVPNLRGEGTLPTEEYIINPWEETWSGEKKETSLDVKSMGELYSMIFKDQDPIVDGFLYPGLYILAGAAKVGKSFLVLQLALSVAFGKELWPDHMAHKGRVLYLALEDNWKRVQERMSKMAGLEPCEECMIAVESMKAFNGLEAQLETFVRTYPDTKLIIIDTLKMIRPMEGDGYSYERDYEFMNSLKNFTDHHDVAMILVHHTRKEKSEDVFDMISGTNGLMASADGTFVMVKPDRMSDHAYIHSTGRDHADQKFEVVRNSVTLAWDLLEEDGDCEDLKKEPLLDAIERVVDQNNGSWYGSPTELVAASGVALRPNAMTALLNTKANLLQKAYGIDYIPKRVHEGRRIILSKYVNDSEAA